MLGRRRAIRTAIAAAVVAASSSVAAPAAAAGGLSQWIPDGFFYLGGGVGYQRADAESSRLSPVPVVCAPAPCETSVDDDALSWSLFAGLQITETVALEAAYAKLPDTYRLRLVDPNFPQPALLAVDQDSDALSLRGVFTLPIREVSAHPLLEPVSVSAMLGVAHWRSESVFVVDTRGVGGAFNRVESEQSGNDVVLGARVSYDVSEQIRVSGAWEHYRGLGDAPVAAPRTAPPLSVQTVRSPADVYSISVSYRFR